MPVQIDARMKLRRLFDWEIAGIRALQYRESRQ